MKKNVLLEQAHAILKDLINPEDIIVDATMGNGHDTLFLAGIAKEVYAFDIQEDALKSTHEKVKDIPSVHLILDSHEHIFNYVEDIRGVIFNLGYLPGGDLSITTLSDTTIMTLNLVLSKLKKNGFVQIVCYPGHPEGEMEHHAIQTWLKTLPKDTYQITSTQFYHQDNKPPYMIMIYKIKDES